jgi:hypothetical protein
MLRLAMLYEEQNNWRRGTFHAENQRTSQAQCLAELCKDYLELEILHHSIIRVILSLVSRE